MGYAVVFWIDERPVRAIGGNWHIPGSSGNQDLAIKVGRALADLLDQYPRGCSDSRSADLDGSPCFKGVRTFHSRDEALLEWKEEKLVVVDFGHDREQFVARLASLRKHSGLDVRQPLRGKCRNNLIQRIGAGSESYESALQRDGLASVYWAYEDWYGDYVRGTSAPKWPLEEMGRAILNMIMLRTEYAVDIGMHGNAINKAATVLTDRPVGFVWAGNCLREVNDPSLPR